MRKGFKWNVKSPHILTKQDESFCWFHVCCQQRFILPQQFWGNFLMVNSRVLTASQMLFEANTKALFNVWNCFWYLIMMLIWVQYKPQSLFVNAYRQAATAICSEDPLIKLRSDRHTNVCLLTQSFFHDKWINNNKSVNCVANIFGFSVHQEDCVCHLKVLS